MCSRFTSEKQIIDPSKDFELLGHVINVENIEDKDILVHIDTKDLDDNVFTAKITIFHPIDLVTTTSR